MRIRLLLIVILLAYVNVMLLTRLQRRDHQWYTHVVSLIILQNY